jgi:hypothetical protein
MKKIIGFLLLCFTINAQAQYVRPMGENIPLRRDSLHKAMPNFWDNVSVGGSFQLQFGTYTYVGLEPLINYHFNSSLMLGIGPIYQYISVNDQYYGHYSSSIYGARIAGMFFLPGEFSKFFIMGEFDVINLPEIQENIYGYYIETRGNLGIPLLGIGYKEPITIKLFFTIYALWDFSNSEYSPYSNPLINAGFDLGIQ